MGEKPATVRDVARAAGVGTTTVSRVINGGHKVHPATAARVEAAIRSLGFRPNRLANSFRAGSLGMIGLIVPDPTQTIYRTIAETIDDRTMHLKMVVATTGSRRDPDRERALVHSFVQRGADGILLATESDDHEYLRAERAHGYPMVFLLDPPRGVSAPSVVGDDRLGGQLAVRHLHRFGHRRIGLIGSEAKPSVRLRADGYRQAVASLGLDADTELIQMRERTAEQGFAAAERLLSGPHPPSALFSTSQDLTLGAVRAVRRHPGPVALVCYGDFRGATLLDPQLTVIKSDPREMGRRAADLLLRQLEGYQDASTVLVIPPTLIARGSGEIPPAT